MARPLVLLETADLLGRYRYVELRAFSLLGLRALRAQDGSLAAALSGLSRAHGSRAEQIETRLPVSVGLPGVTDLTRSPSAALDDSLDRLVELDDVELAVALSLLYRQMRKAYAHHRARCSAFADAPVARVLDRLIFDVAERARECVVLGESLGAPAKTPKVVRALAAQWREIFGPLTSEIPLTVAESSA